MKKYSIIIAIALASKIASAYVLDPFLPANEYYKLDTHGIGYATAFAGSNGSDTTAAIAVNGKVWENGKYVQKYAFAGWATGCASYNKGSGITGSGTDKDVSYWTNPANAFGRATASDTSDVVVLGDGGSITLTFDAPICNGGGYDFVVFENSLNGTFLEFAFVEVSTDGKHFVRFPNFYLGTSPVGSDNDDGGGNNDPSKAYNLGSKYEIGFGNGYDLSELESAYNYAISHYDGATNSASQTSTFSAGYMAELIENYAYIDLESVNYVKIVDIVGDGNTFDSMGRAIYDAYPTHGTPGFDVTGVGVLNAGANIPESSAIGAFAGVFALGFSLIYRRLRARIKKNFLF